MDASVCWEEEEEEEGGRSDGTDTRSKISFYPDSVKNIRKIKINLFYEHRLDICE